MVSAGIKYRSSGFKTRFTGKNICVACGLAAAALTWNGCGAGTSNDHSAIAADSVSIARGQKIFAGNCSSCHNFRQDGIGPQLGGITAKEPVDWIRHFIKDPKRSIESGDQRSKELFEKFHSVMPSFAQFSDDDIDHVISYLHAQVNTRRAEEE